MCFIPQIVIWGLDHKAALPETAANAEQGTAPACFPKASPTCLQHDSPPEPARKDAVSVLFWMYTLLLGGVLLGHLVDFWQPSWVSTPHLLRGCQPVCSQVLQKNIASILCHMGLNSLTYSPGLLLPSLPFSFIFPMFLKHLCLPPWDSSFLPASDLSLLSLTK